MARRGKRLATATRVAVQVWKGARSLITIDGTEGDFEALINGDLDIPKGALVRVLPPADATDETLESLTAFLRKQGVASLKMLPRARAAEVVPRLAVREPTQAPRRLVEAMVEESNSADRKALGEYLDGIMAKVGL